MPDLTIERLERAWEMLIDVTEGQLMPFGNGQYEEITKVYGEQIRDVKNLITAEIKRLSVENTQGELIEHTEQLPCEWCSEYPGDISAEKWLSCEEDGYTHHYLSQQPVNYCPQCGQAIDWSEE